MPTLDYSVLPFQVFIGDLEITELIDRFEISRPIPEQGNTLTWTGAFNIYFNPEFVTESQIDPVTNPAYFRPYQKQCIFSIMGFIVCRFYIERYVYDSQEKTGEASIYQILDIANSDEPSDEIELSITAQGN